MGWRERVASLLSTALEDQDDEDSGEALAWAAMCATLTTTSQPPMKKKRGGSSPGKRANIDRGRVAAATLLYNDYFAPRPLFPEALFRRRFRMSRKLFARIVDKIAAADNYFTQRVDALGVLGFSPHQKVTAALRLLCYGVCADATDEYVHIAESTAMESLKRFTTAVVECFGEEYLRDPTPVNIAKHTAINATRGFPGMFRSLDCTQWVWKNCPTAWHGMYQDRDGDMSMVMEAVATKDLWIWHSFVGMPGSNNDINVVERSPLMVNWLSGSAPEHEYEINGRQQKMCYLLCDGIYPEWAVFVKSVRHPSTPKEKHFAKAQESVRKDVERCFGVLQGRFGILAQPARLWDAKQLKVVWKCCVALHNMIIEDEKDETDENYIQMIDCTLAAQDPMALDELLAGLSTIQDHAAHARLQRDLMEHQWMIRERQNSNTL